jgi:hypothetical protein
VGPNLAKALAAAQGDLKPPKFDSSSTAFGGRPYRYASLSSVVDAARCALVKHGISVFQPVTVVDGRLVVETILVHSSGDQFTFGAFSVPMASKMQDIGGQLTYSRRYSLCAALSLAAEEDTDCQGEGAPTTAQEAPKPKKLVVVPPTRTEAAMAGAAAPAGVLRFEGVVERIYENEKSSKIVLESGEQLVAWNDLAGLDTMQIGGRYWFSCKPSKNPKYPAPSITDFGEAGLKGGEEIPF